MGETRTAYTILVWNPLGIRTSKAEDNINTDLREIDYEDEI
jgi:hypothetical protein